MGDAQEQMINQVLEMANMDDPTAMDEQSKEIIAAMNGKVRGVVVERNGCR